MSLLFRSLLQRGCILSGCVLVLALCGFAAPPAPPPASQNPPELHQPPAASDFVGDAACMRCHQPEAARWSSSPHHLDSALATPATVLGDFSPGHNILRTRDPNLVFGMIRDGDTLYQSSINIADPKNLKGTAETFDIAIGSGRRGQTSLFWKGDELYELPVSWWSYTHEWVNSPGYPDGEVHFNRPIIPRCLECHTTWFESLGDPNHFTRSSMILGIGCEKCHGPGREHVERETSPKPPAPGSAQEAIVNPAHLSRDRQMDLCASCHAGVGESLLQPESYRPGDVLADYITVTPPPPDQPVDVHGNQVSALERSRCFSSEKLTCSTCHNVHERQEDVDSYSTHCLECHTVQSCGRFKTMGEAIRTKCVECHMPEGRSTGLTSNSGGKILQAELRRHRIAIYPDADLPAALREPGAASHHTLNVPSRSGSR